ncbi:hypothetical protein [Nocardia sp. NPDC023988]|uniref:hypothetical protein n=1 Tax=unclassified Nocardia TaxID=2637762 RepID=UPI0033E64D60
MGNGEEFGGWGAAFIWAVVGATIGVPIWLWTGQSLWLLFLLLPGIGFSSAGRGVVWMVLSVLPRGVILVAGWFFVLLAIVDAVAMAVWKLAPSVWTWPVAVVSALVLGVLMYLAVASEVLGGWQLTNGAELVRVDHEIARAKQRPDEGLSPVWSSLYSAGPAAGLRPPPFAIGGFELADRLGQYHAVMARRHWISGNTDTALEHAAEASAVRRHMVAMPLGRTKSQNFAQSLYEQAFYLSELGRSAETVEVRAEEIAERRRLLARFDKRYPVMVAKAAKPHATTKTKQLVVDLQTYGKGLKTDLASALTAQAAALTELGRTDEATDLRSEAESLAPADD